MIGKWSREIVVSNELGRRLLRMRYLYPSNGKMFRPRLIRGVA